MNRKEFLKAGTTFILGGIFISSINGCSAGRFIIPQYDGETLIIKKSSIREDEKFVLIELQNSPAPLYLGKSSEEYIALLLQCTHLGCTVDIFPDKFICPCHKSKFNSNGEVLEAPALKNLKKYPLRTDNENIYINITG